MSAPQLQPQSSSQKLVYLDVLRVIAILAVILNHVTSNRLYVADLNSMEWSWISFYGAFARWGVPAFVMVSGALFLNPHRLINYHKLFFKNTLRLVRAYVIWSGFYALFDLSIGQITTTSDFVVQWIKGPTHLWFLWMLVGLYILIPLLRMITLSDNATAYFIALTMVFTMIIPFLQIINDDIKPYLLSPTSQPIIAAGDAFWANYNGAFNYHFTLGYVSYFMLGHYLNIKEFSRKKRHWLYGLGFLSLLFTIGYTHWSSQLKGEMSIGGYVVLQINTCLIAVAVFVLIKSINYSRLTQRGLQILSTLSQATFSVFLIHGLFWVAFLTFTPLDTSVGNPIFTPLLLLLGLTIVSFLTAIVLNRIPFIKKYLL